ncbi:amphi-Trp domain-containing protein [Nocardia sp. NPDC058519]|uniref:amphi-Trp domain-containing protein n=1 Tax=unclassified Nocardia TaxID=2637762 RepID=UPI003656E35D
MPKLEIKRKSELSRKEISEHIIAIGHALAGGSEVQLGESGDSIQISVANRVQWELEIEVDGDKTEIEIEISWHDNPSRETPTQRAAPAKSVRRGRPHKA